MAAVTGGGRAVGRRRPRVGLAAVVVACCLFYLLPLLAMARFAFQRIPVASLGWGQVFDRWTLDGLSTVLGDEAFRSSLGISLRLAVGSVVLTTAVLLPTALWAHLRAPRLRSLVEGITLLPWVVPPIALVD